MVNTITKGIHKVIQEKGCCNMKKNTIICISREFGSGGREVGQQLSKKLGIPFYDKEILARVAEESDMSEEFVKNHEENAVYSHIINVPIGHRFPGVDTEEIMTPEKLFMIQAHVIMNWQQRMNPAFSWEDVQMWCLRITKTATVSLSTVL